MHEASHATPSRNSASDPALSMADISRLSRSSRRSRYCLALALHAPHTRPARGVPKETLDRCTRIDNFEIVSGAALKETDQSTNGLEIETTKGNYTADFVISRTGMANEFSARPELDQFAGNVATWSDCYQPPDNDRHERLGRFPYLSLDFALVEKVPCQTPWISNIHLFSIFSTRSFGPSGSAINAMITVVHWYHHRQRH